MYYCQVAFENSVYKPSYSAWSGLTMASSATEFAGLYGQEGRIEKLSDGISAYITYTCWIEGTFMRSTS